MTPERDRLLAEKARIEAELAKLDAPDPLLMEARKQADKWWPDEAALTGSMDGSMWMERILAALRRGMELAAAPLMPRDAGMSEEEIAELARECLGAVVTAGELFTSDGHFKVNQEKALTSLHKTLKRALLVRWPGEALAAMEQAREAWAAKRWDLMEAAIATLTEQIERMRGEAQQPSGNTGDE
jgi:hypothetical protein